MGTNYYLHRNVCSHCGRSDEPLHIGKSSYGWCFALHVDADKGIDNLDDWKVLWSADNVNIVDEYDRYITADEMVSIITDRHHPKGLSRVKIDGRHCIGHGDGTYDLIPGEFS